MIRWAQFRGARHAFYQPGLFLASLALLALLIAGLGPQTLVAGETEPTPFSFLPLVAKMPASACPTYSNRSYGPGPAFQYDLDNPVRPAEAHADKNIALRSYAPVTDPTLRRELINLGTDDPVRPPQLATLFAPDRVPPLSTLYQVHHWQWAPSPDPGSRAGLIGQPPVTAVGLQTNRGEILQVPDSGYDIGGGQEVILLFADPDTVTLRYAREDSAGSAGYTLHIDHICTDVNLLALYLSADAPGGPRYTYVPPAARPYAYPLPTLAAGQTFGTAAGTEIVVAVVDSGAFQDPRSCAEWWQIRPGYGSCADR